MKIAFIAVSVLCLTACASKTLPQETPTQHKLMDKNCERHIHRPSPNDSKAYGDYMNEIKRCQRLGY